MRRSIMMAALLLAAAPALAGARQDATVLMPEDPAMNRIWNDWGFAEIIVAGDTAYISGVVAGLRDGETDLEAAYTRAFDRIGASLTRAGLGWDDVVDITSYHTDVTTQMPAIIKVKHRYIRAPYPAWTAIGVSRLIPDNGITEIKLVAKVPTSK
jgi:enamine deaminase RidA (YjgF/YER057c/UK114 family)